MWHPPVETLWQWQIDGEPLDLAIDVPLYDIDLFYYSRDDVARLHALGRHVFCYVDVGAWEAYRPDAGRFPPDVIGRETGWKGERYLDIRRLDVLGPILAQRLDLCQQKGFDGVEGDYQANYDEDTGFPLTLADQLTFNRWLIAQAHARHLSVGLKNGPKLAAQLAAEYDWALNEQCFAFDECEGYRAFIALGKPVFQVEYDLEPRQFCPQANALQFNAMQKHRALDAYRVACR